MRLRSKLVKAPSRKEEKSSRGFKGFLHQTVHSAFESCGIHLPSRHSRRQEDDDDTREVEADFEHGFVKNRSLPLSTLIEVLKQKTGKYDIDVGKLRPTLFDVFGEDASPKAKKFMGFLMDKLQQGDSEGASSGGFMSMVGNLAQDFLK
ncbi:hypothetical protein GIB67_040589 [Kingdonia uniflora]|uniref:Uncharacterized protein n=1 Tax=Kingdonia uniflora TaxID=39325 RepID=A0A7J7M8W4_9MAGN|nr:hypothetical protein GIB67_040589 [Kingdonia uniflora]